MDPSTIILAGIVVVIVIIASIVVYRQRKFKKNIIAKAIMKRFPDADYNPDSYMSKDEYNQIGCMRKGTTFLGSDLLKANTSAGTPFRYCEINTYTHVDKHTETVFKGGIFSFKYPKHFSTRVYMVSKHGWGKGAFKSEFFKTHKLETESTEFNDTYKTYADDDETAFYLLTPQIMEEFVELKKIEKNAVIVSFKDNWLHIAIPNLNLFKAPVIGLKNKKKIDKFLDKTKNDLQKITDFVDMFRLDRNAFK